MFELPFSKLYALTRLSSNFNLFPIIWLHYKDVTIFISAVPTCMSPRLKRTNNRQIGSYLNILPYLTAYYVPM